MRKVKFIAVVLIFIMIFSTLTGCSVKKYNAVLYERAIDWVDEDFLDKNRVKGYYKNKDYREGERLYIFEHNAPLSRTFLITSKEEFDKIICEFPDSIDFDKEIVILYLYYPDMGGGSLNLKQIKLRDGILTVKINFVPAKGDTGSMPTPSCMMIKINKIEIDEAKIEIRKK